MIDYESLKKRYPNLHKIIAVSKTQSIEKIKEAIDLGYIDFGENKAQELKEKASIFPDLCWHFIGHLQSNKVKEVVKYTSWIHSIDSLKLIQECDKETRKQNKLINILIQINLTNEAQKSGCLIEDLESLVKALESCSHLIFKGIMVIGPSSMDLDQTQNVFNQAHQLFNQLQTNHPQCSELSMGMSHDYSIAIAKGATMIRLGTMLFGQRK